MGAADTKKSPGHVCGAAGSKEDRGSNLRAEAHPGAPTRQLSSCARRASPGGGRTRAPRSGGAAAPSGLPCLNSNKCNEGTPVDTLPEGVKQALNSLSTNHRKTAYKLAKSVARLCGKYGVERVGFLTLTFADHVTCAREAGRRYRSLRTGVLAERYTETICVLERMKSGRIHFHLLVVMGWDIRTGFDFSAASRGDYSSANQGLRAEWAFWRRNAPNYRFGRTELMPVKSNEEGLSKYVGKYIAKHVGQRETRDKGVRLVRYSKGASIGSAAFMFVSPRSKLWRWQVGQFAQRNGCSDLDQVREKFGKRWAYYQRAEIVAIEPPQEEPVVRTGADTIGGPLSLWWTWVTDRARFAADVASAVGADVGDAWNVLHRRIRPEISFEVPRWKGDPTPRPIFDDDLEATVIWSDGRVERGSVMPTSVMPGGL